MSHRVALCVVAAHLLGRSIAADPTPSRPFTIATVPNPEPASAPSIAVGVDVPSDPLDGLMTSTSSGVAAATTPPTADITPVVLMPGPYVASPTSFPNGLPPPHPPPPRPSGPPPASMARPGNDTETGECRLLGPFALFVQLALGGLALMSLVFKRWRERPQRPVKIWFFDVSKQVVGSVLVHVANVFMSMLTSGTFSVTLSPAVASAISARTLGAVLGRAESAQSPEEGGPNPCSFYLLNLAIDTTIGIPILIFLLRTFTALAAHTPLGHPRESIQSGHYGSPPNALWWLKQSFLYFCGLFGMKLCVLIIFLMFPWISIVGDWALRWTQGDENLQIIFSMMLFPLIMNALQYYIIDSFIKESHGGAEYVEIDGRGDGSGEDDHHQRREDTRRSRPYDRLEEGGSDVGGDEDPSLAEPEADIIASKAGKTRETEYDPLKDGDGSTAVGSLDRSPESSMKVPRELLPKE